MNKITVDYRPKNSKRSLILYARFEGKIDFGEGGVDHISAKKVEKRLILQERLEKKIDFWARKGSSRGIRDTFTVKDPPPIQSKVSRMVSRMMQGPALEGLPGLPGALGSLEALSEALTALGALRKPWEPWKPGLGALEALGDEKRS